MGVTRQNRACQRCQRLGRECGQCLGPNQSAAPAAAAAGRLGDAVDAETAAPDPGPDPVAVAHDEALVELHAAFGMAEREYQESLRDHAEKKRTIDAAVGRGHDPDSDSMRIWRRQLDEAEARVDAATDSKQAALDDIGAHEESYDGWSRFYLVTNVGGHLHSSRACSTCRPTTQYAMYPNLSGASEAAAVDEVGPVLCTVCFPSAPTEWTDGQTHAAKAEAEARAAEKEAKAAAKREKQLAAALFEGDPARAIRSRDRDTIATIRQAKMWLTNAATWNTPRNGEPYEHPSYPGDTQREIAEALATREGKTVDTVLAEAADRASKRR